MLIMLGCEALPSKCYMCIVIILLHSHNDHMKLVSISPILQMRKQRHGGAEYLAHGHVSVNNGART